MIQTSSIRVKEVTPVSTIGLVMIVRDEAGIIERCLDSVRPLIDFALIEDTGSTDGTQAIIKNWLEREKLPGQVYDNPWQDFASNRNHVLAKLRRDHPELDFALMMDADDQLILDQGLDVAALKHDLRLDAYKVAMRLHEYHHSRVQICSNRRNFTFRGIIHEVLLPPPGTSEIGLIEGFHIEARSEGARSRNPDRFKNDAAILERALGQETDSALRSRYVFYLAQTYISTGEREKALSNYVRRAQMGGWDEEVYVSLYRAGMLQGQLGRPLESVLRTFKQAMKVVDNRIDAHHGASRACRLAGRYREGYEIAKSGLGTPPPPEGLFLTIWIYDYGLQDEFAQNALALGHHDECVEACEQMLAMDQIPDDVRERARKNADIAKQRLAKAAISS